MNKKSALRILILTFYYRPDLCAGSFRSSAFIKVLKTQLSVNDTVDILTTMPNRYHSYSENAREIESCGNINIKRIRIPSHKSGFFDQAYSFGTYFFSVLTFIRKQEYDIVFATSSRLFTAFLGAIIARMKSAYLYLDIRDIFVDTLKSILKKRSKILLPLFSFIETFTIKSANRINLVSKGFEHYFESKNKKIKYSFFTNGIDDEFIDVSFEKVSSSSNKIITYAGNIGQGQGLEKIIPSIAKKIGKKYEFRVVGDGGMKSKLEKVLNEQQIKNVKILKPVKRAALISIYKESDYLFLHLNDYVAFRKVLPSKVFEYAATGKPVLAGLSGFAKKYVRENFDNFILFNPCDAKSFIKTFEKFKPNEKKQSNNLKKFYRMEIMKEMVDDFLSISIQK